VAVFPEFAAIRIAKITAEEAYVNMVELARFLSVVSGKLLVWRDTMSNEKDSEGTLYHIKVKGNLDPKWADWFDGFALTFPGNDETLLSGRVADQAALHGILNKINRLGLVLILVAQVGNGNLCP
jgi:hypothetical protein